MRRVYFTNFISGFIANSAAGSRKLKVSGHLVILNWNTRASEIINDLLFCSGRQKVVVLVENRKNEIIKEIDERIAATIARENRERLREARELKGLKRISYYRKNRIKNNITVVVREGDIFSSKQLHDVSLEQANAVVILGNENNNALCKYEKKEREEEIGRGNTQTIKTLMQVSDITSAAYSADNQIIIVEISDDWTWELVAKIIRNKRVAGKCNIVPVRVNQILGQILAQFSLMPELNLAYRELFSNQGATFFVQEMQVEDEKDYITRYFNTHTSAIPLTGMKDDGKEYFFYSAESLADVRRVSRYSKRDYSVKLNRDYWIEKKTVIILGHNSRCRDIMQGFSAFRSEWNYKDGSDEILRVVVIDDAASLEKLNYYREYPFVVKTVAASIYDKDLICSTIEEIVDNNDEDTSVLILSDDSMPNDMIDATALANLVYVQDIIADKLKADPDFDRESIDIVVEIIDPKHHDVVSSYSVNNVVISNRYISKMITQIGEKEAIFTFYSDILTYDEENTESYESKEVYTKKVTAFFEELPAPCTQLELVHAVWAASIDPSIPESQQNPTLVLGYVKPGGKVTLFGKNQEDHMVELKPGDKIIVFTNH